MEMYRDRLFSVEAVCGEKPRLAISSHPSCNQQRLADHGTPTIDALFVVALAKMAPTASRYTVRERPGRKARQEQRMSIHHRVRRGSDL